MVRILIKACGCWLKSLVETLDSATFNFTQSKTDPFFSFLGLLGSSNSFWAIRSHVVCRRGDGFQMTCWLHVLLTSWYWGSCGFVFYVPSAEIRSCNEIFQHDDAFSSQLHPVFPSPNGVWTCATRLPQIDESSRCTGSRSLHRCCAAGSGYFLNNGRGGSCHSSVLVTPPVNAVHFPRVHFPPMVLRFQ